MNSEKWCWLTTDCFLSQLTPGYFYSCIVLEKSLSKMSEGLESPLVAPGRNRSISWRRPKHSSANPVRPLSHWSRPLWLPLLLFGALGSDNTTLPKSITFTSPVLLAWKKVWEIEKKELLEMKYYLKEKKTDICIHEFSPWNLSWQLHWWWERDIQYWIIAKAVVN